MSTLLSLPVFSCPYKTTKQTELSFSLSFQRFASLRILKKKKINLVQRMSGNHFRDERRLPCRFLLRLGWLTISQEEVINKPFIIWLRRRCCGIMGKQVYKNSWSGGAFNVLSRTFHVNELSRIEFRSYQVHRLTLALTDVCDGHLIHIHIIIHIHIPPTWPALYKSCWVRIAVDASLDL